MTSVTFLIFCAMKTYPAIPESQGMENSLASSRDPLRLAMKDSFSPCFADDRYTGLMLSAPASESSSTSSSTQPDPAIFLSCLFGRSTRNTVALSQYRIPLQHLAILTRSCLRSFSKYIIFTVSSSIDPMVFSFMYSAATREESM